MVVEDGKPESEVADFELSIRDRKRNGRGGARGCGAGHGDAPVDTRSQKEWSWRTANLSLKWPTLSCRYAIAKGMVVEVRVAAVPGMEMPRSIRDRKRNGRGGRDSTTSPCHRVRSIRDRKRNGRGGSTRRGPTEIVPRVDTRSQKEWSWRSQGASTPSSRAYRRYAIAKGMVVEAPLDLGAAFERDHAKARQRLKDCRANAVRTKSRAASKGNAKPCHRCRRMVVEAERLSE